jgi:hypothetical protein
MTWRSLDMLSLRPYVEFRQANNPNPRVVDVIHVSLPSHRLPLPACSYFLVKDRATRPKCVEHPRTRRAAQK